MPNSASRPSFAQGPQIAKWSWWLLIAVLAAGCALSFHEWELNREAEADLLQQRFDKDVDDAVTLVRARVAANEQLLRAGLALFTASDAVSRAEWRTFTQQMRLREQYPGLQSLGYAEQVSTTRIAQHEEAVHRDGAALRGYAVHPPSTQPTATPIVYIEPGNSRNLSVLGLDLASLPVLQTAMAQARDTAEAALSGRIVLNLPQGGAPSIRTVLFMPIYHPHLPLGSVTERRTAIQGYVFGSARMDESLSAVLQGQVDAMSVELFDGWEPLPASRMFSLRTEIGENSPAAHPLERVVQFEIGQRFWTLKFRALPEFEALAPAGRATTVLSTGLLLTLMFTTVLGVLIRLRAMAELQAADMGTAYRRSEARAQTIVAHTAEGIITTNAEGLILTANPAAEAIFGWPAQTLAGQGMGRLLALPLHELPQTTGVSPLRRDLAARTKDGREILVRAATSAMVLDGQPGYVVMVSDMTQQKHAELAAARVAQLNTAILQSAPFMVITTDETGLVQTVNASTERMLWYRRDELVGRSVFETLLLPEELLAHATQASIDLGMHVPPRALGARALRGLADESEWTFLRKDGSRLPVNMALAAMRDARGLPTGFVGIAYDISERKRSESYIRHLAHHDALTALPNRVLLQDRVGVAIEHAKRSGRQVAVMLLDLDHFKQINDSLGHGVGDLVLQNVAGRLRSTVRQSDTVARMGGDEFCVVLSDTDGATEATLVAHKILEAVRPAVVLGPRELHVTVSIGSAVYPDDGLELATLLQNADIAMYESKKSGRNAYRAFAPQMHAESTLRITLEEGLRAALANREMVLHYQPKVALSDGRLQGVEALLRWNRPGHGLVSPCEFIPLAEDTGLIVPIGEWVLQQACGDAMWLQQRLGYPVAMAINVSPRQFRQAGLLQRVDEALASAGLLPELLELEITESILIEDSVMAGELLTALHRKGVRLTIDDFGTGFSSLGYLHRFPVSTLKIDQSFVADLQTNPYSEAIVASVVGLARALKLHVVAEGVETAAQQQLLRSHQCDGGQGYLFSPPLALQALCDLLEARRGEGEAVPRLGPL